MKKRDYGIAVLAILLGFAVEASGAQQGGDTSQSAPASTKQSGYAAPYPFTSDELWEKLLQVADGSQDGYVPKEQVDKVFGMNLPLNQAFLQQYHQKIYTLIRGQNWYFNMSVGDNNYGKSLFFFSWGDDPGSTSTEYPPPPPAGMCINVYTIRPALQRLGWILRREVRGTSEPIYSDTYRTGARYGILKIEFLPSDNCLRTFRVSASLSEAHELPVE